MRAAVATLTTSAALFAPIASGCAEETSGEKEIGTAAGTAASTSGATEAATTEEAVTANPDGTYHSNCDLLLKEGANYSYYGLLVGDAKIRNTGNIGIVVNVKASWDRAGFGPFRSKKEVRLETGQRKTVHLRQRITQEGIDEVQSSGGYQGQGNFCRVKVKIIDTFGEPQ